MKYVRKNRPTEAAKSMINAFMVSQIDYCDSLLTEELSYQFETTESFKRSCSATVWCTEIFAYHASPSRQATLDEMSGERVQLKLCVTDEALHNIAPEYLKKLCILPTNERRSTLHSADSKNLVRKGTASKFD